MLLLPRRIFEKIRHLKKHRILAGLIHFSRLKLAFFKKVVFLPTQPPGPLPKKSRALVYLGLQRRRQSFSATFDHFLGFLRPGAPELVFLNNFNGNAAARFLLKPDSYIAVSAGTEHFADRESSVDLFRHLSRRNTTFDTPCSC